MKVLIGYDGSIHAEAAIADLDQAGLPTHTEARVLSIVEQPFDPGADEAAEEVCNRLQRSFRHWTLQSETATGGHPSQTILERAREWPADLIVVGTHGRSALGRLVLGSVSTAVARDAPCSVRVARPPHKLREGPLRLLIGYDGSPQAKDVVNEVCARAWPPATEVRLVGVVEARSASRTEEIAGIADTVQEITVEEHGWLKELANQSAQRLAVAGLLSSSVVVDGNPRETLLHEAAKWNPDSIFVGARGHALIERLLLGSVSTDVSTHAPCTVEVVRRR